MLNDDYCATREFNVPPQHHEIFVYALAKSHLHPLVASHCSESRSGRGGGQLLYNSATPASLFSIQSAE